MTNCTTDKEDESPLSFKESIYSRGYKMDSSVGCNIFTLIRDIQRYTAEMDHDDAVEAAVYATADSIKDGVIHI